MWHERERPLLEQDHGPRQIGPRLQAGLSLVALCAVCFVAIKTSFLASVTSKPRAVPTSVASTELHSEGHGEQEEHHSGRGDAACPESRAFPKGFRWATATAAYQVEGGVHEASRSPSIWDDFCSKAMNCDGKQTLQVSGNCTPIECADVTDDVFHKYPEDFAMMSRMHVTSYRMSISWSRLMKWDSSSKKMVANPEGVAFYRNMFHELRRWFIEPMVTLYHWDLPLALEQNLSPPGMLNEAIPEHFLDFARLAFTEFGHLVPFWFTFNEPYTFSYMGYHVGAHAPGHKGSPTKSYNVTHHILLAHGAAVKLYREMRSAGTYVMGEGRITMVLNCDWGMPSSPESYADRQHAKNWNEFVLDWLLGPLVYGEYPSAMKAKAGGNLPTFTAEQRDLVAGSLDGVLGLNHYTTFLITGCDSDRSEVKCESLNPGWERDLGVQHNHHPKGSRSSPNPSCAWLHGYPPGYGHLLDYVHERYPSLEILLTENGWCGEDTIFDEDQLWYYQKYLAEVLAAIKRGIPIIGYTAWSLMDNYEWGSFAPRFGLWSIDYKTLERVPKTAALWFAKVAQGNCLL